MTSSYPPQRNDTAIQLLSYYENFLIQQQEQDPSSLKVKIKEGDTQHYLTDRDWDNVLNEADCRCIICTEQILQAHKVIHSACACKPYPVIHAGCMLELQQRGEREVNGKESNTPANNEKKKQSFYVLKCGWCNTPYLGEESFNWYQEGLAILQAYEPEMSYDVVVEGNETFFSGEILLDGLVGVQNVLKSIMLDWHTSSNYNPILGKVLSLLGWMHIKYAQVVTSEQMAHNFFGRLCIAAAINEYGPRMTLWGINSVRYLVGMCKEYAQSPAVDKIELATQRHIVPEVIWYAKQVATSVPKPWQVDLQQKAHEYLLSALTDLAENDLFLKDWLLPFIDLKMKGAEEKTKKIKQGVLTECKQQFLDSVFPSKLGGNKLAGSVAVSVFPSKLGGYKLAGSVEV